MFNNKVAQCNDAPTHLLKFRYCHFLSFDGFAIRAAWACVNDDRVFVEFLEFGKWNSRCGLGTPLNTLNVQYAEILHL